MSQALEQLTDREAIRNVALRYCRGVDRLDAELMKSAYWPDATDDHGTFVGNAWEFVEGCMESHLRWRSTSHCISNHMIELERGGTRARGEIYNVTYLFRKDEDVLDTWHGRYLDVYEKRRDEWRILERVCVHEGTHAEPVEPIPIGVESFRDGAFDRGTPGRAVGP